MYLTLEEVKRAVDELLTTQNPETPTTIKSIDLRNNNWRYVRVKSDATPDWLYGDSTGHGMDRRP